jgi:dTDP-4-dehydrorhamnose 3,5-epimerase
MQIERFAIPGPLVLTPEVFADSRGTFSETWNQKQFAHALAVPLAETPAFVQDNQSVSSHLVLRGLHYQLPPHPQAKLVRCGSGEIFDVAVDIRCSSPTYGQWVGVHLSAQNRRQLWVPPGFAHGFLVMSSTAEVLYKTTEFWHKASERSIRWDDPALAIPWPFTQGDGSPSVSEKDRRAPTLEEAAALGDLFP